MAKIGVPSNTKIFEAVQSLFGEEIILPKGAFFVPFRGHELVIARVEEIAHLTKEGHLDLSFVTLDHFLEDYIFSLKTKMVQKFLDFCQCKLFLITAEKKFENRNSVEVFTEFHKERGREAVIATRFQNLVSHFLICEKKFVRKTMFEWDLHFSFPRIRKIRGAEELSIILGAADFAVSRVESGRTLKLNNLFVVERILSSCLAAVRREDLEEGEAEEVLSALLNK